MLKNEQFNIFDIAKKNNFKRFIYFQVTLRDKIKYDIELIDGYLNFDDVSKNQQKNHVIFACQTYFRENQLVPPKYNAYFLTFNPINKTYSYETSIIDVLLECSDGVFKKMANNLNNDAIEIKLYELLEYFSYKYNLASSGNDFINTAELCVGSFKCLFFYRDKKTGEYKNSNGLITPSLSIIKNQNEPNLNFQKVVNTDIPAWKFFVNKTKYYYSVFNNLDCVVNAAIAIESYILFLIKKCNKYDDYKNEYKNTLGFNSALKFCIDNNIIKKEISDMFASGYENIGKYRSLILHGAIDSPIIDRKQAQKAYETIVDLFSSINQELYENTGLLIPDKYFENDYNIMKSILKNYEEGNYEEALEKLDDNIENNIFKDLSIFNRGKCYIALKKSKEAINDFNQCINNRYRLIESYNYLGMELSKLNKHEEAKIIYLKGIELDDSYSEYYYNLGIEQQFLKEYDNAIESYNKALSISEYASYYYNLGTVYYYKNDYNNTLLNYKKAIHLEPNNSKYLYERAFLYEVLNDPSKAEKDIVKCLRFYQNEPDIAFIRERIYQIGVLYQKQGKYKDAIRMFNKGIKIDRSRDSFYQARGNCYRALGNNTKALNNYKKALEVFPNSSTNLINMIYSYLDVGDLINSKRYIEILSEKYGNLDTARNCIDIFHFNEYQKEVITHEQFLFYFKNNHNDLEKTELYKKISEKIGDKETKKFLKM